MSRTPNQQPPGVSMRKNGARTPASGAPPQLPVPWSVNAAVIAVGAMVLFTLLHLLLARGFTTQLTHLLVHANETAKNPIKNYNGPKQLAEFRKGLLLQGLVVSAALVALALATRRTRSASGSRWALLIIIVLLAQSNGPLTVIPISGYPGAMQVVRMLMGVSSVVVLVFLLLPLSMNYFRDCKIASRPEGAAARPGLGAMFGPRGATARRGAASGAAAARRAASAPPTDGTAEAANPARARSKAKVRADAEAIAKGAELARSRAKASKSRRD